MCWQPPGVIGRDDVLGQENGIKIDTAVLFVKLAIEEMVKTRFNPGGPVAMYESEESGISPMVVIPRITQ